MTEDSRVAASQDGVTQHDGKSSTNVSRLVNRADNSVAKSGTQYVPPSTNSRKSGTRGKTEQRSISVTQSSRNWRGGGGSIRFTSRQRSESLTTMRERQPDAQRLSLLISDFSTFQVTEQTLWHYSHMFTGVPIPQPGGIDLLSKTKEATNGVPSNITGSNLASDSNVQVLDVLLMKDLNDRSDRSESLINDYQDGINITGRGDNSSDKASMATASISSINKKIRKQKSKNHQLFAVNNLEDASFGRQEKLNFQVSQRAGITFSQNQTKRAVEALVTPQTGVSFVYKSYSIVIAIDVSASVLNTIATRSSRDNQDEAKNRSMNSCIAIINSVINEEVRAVLSLLSERMAFKNDNQNFARYQYFNPDIFLSVVAVGGKHEPFRPLIKSFPLFSNSFDSKTSNLPETQKFSGHDARSVHYVNFLVDELMERMSALEKCYSDIEATTQRSRFKNSVADNEMRHVDNAMSSALDSCMLLLDEMPQDACPEIILVTDGVMSLPPAGSYDNIILRLARKSIPCHSIRIRGAELGHCAWGCVADPEGLAFISRATGGFYFDIASAASPFSAEGLSSLAESVLSGRNILHSDTKTYRVRQHGGSTKHAASANKDTSASSEGNSEEEKNWMVRGSEPNLLQKAVLWRYSPLTQKAALHVSLRGLMNRDNTHRPIVNEIRTARAIQAIDYPFPWVGESPPSPLCRERVSEYNLVVDLNHILSCRTREGFTVDDNGLNFGILSGVKKRRGSRGGNTSDRFQNNALKEATMSKARKNDQTESSVSLELKMNWHPEVDIRYVITELAPAESQRSRKSDQINSEVKKDSTSSSQISNDGMQLKISIEITASIVFLRKFKEAAQIVSFHKSTAKRGSQRQSNRSGKRAGRSSKTSRKPIGDKILEEKRQTSPFLLHHLLSSIHEVDKVFMHLSSPSSSDIVASSGLGNAHKSEASKKKQDSFLGGKPIALFVTLGRLSTSLWSRWFHMNSIEILIGGTTVIGPLNSSSTEKKSSNHDTMMLKSNRLNHESSTRRPNSMAFKKILTVVDHWSSRRIGQRVYTKLLMSDAEVQSSARKIDTKDETSQKNLQGGRAVANNSNPANENGSGISFLLIRISFTTDRVVVLDVAFYSASSETRKREMSELRGKLVSVFDEVVKSSTGGFRRPSSSFSDKNNQGQDGFSPHMYVLDKPISMALVNPDHFESVNNNTVGTKYLHKPNEINKTDGSRTVKNALPISNTRSSLDPNARDSNTICVNRSHWLHSYFWKCAWSWDFQESQFCEDVLKLVIRAREQEDFKAVRSLRGSQQGAVLAAYVDKQGQFISPVLANRKTSETMPLGPNTLLQYAIWRSSANPLRMIAAAFMEPRDTSTLESMEEWGAFVTAFSTLQQHDSRIMSARLTYSNLQTHQNLAINVVEKLEAEDEEASVTTSKSSWSDVAFGAGMIPSQFKWQSQMEPKFDLSLLLSLSNRSRENFSVFDTDPATNELENIEFAPLRSLNVGLFQSLIDSLKMIADFEVPDDPLSPYLGKSLNFVKRISDKTILIARVVPLSKVYIHSNDDDDNDDDNDDDTKERQLSGRIDELHRQDAFGVNFYECAYDDIVRVANANDIMKKSKAKSNTEYRQRARQVVLVVRKFKNHLQAIHTRSFTRGVYWGLRKSHWVSSEDFRSAREKCVEVTIDIGAALFRELQVRAYILRQQLKDHQQQIHSESLDDDGTMFLDPDDDRGGKEEYLPSHEEDSFKILDSMMLETVSQFFTRVREPDKTVRRNGYHYFYHGRILRGVDRSQRNQNIDLDTSRMTRSNVQSNSREGITHENSVSLSKSLSLDSSSYYTEDEDINHQHPNLSDSRYMFGSESDDDDHDDGDGNTDKDGKDGKDGNNDNNSDYLSDLNSLSGYNDEDQYKHKISQDDVSVNSSEGHRGNMAVLKASMSMDYSWPKPFFFRLEVVRHLGRGSRNSPPVVVPVQDSFSDALLGLSDMKDSEISETVKGSQQSLAQIIENWNNKVKSDAIYLRAPRPCKIRLVCITLVDEEQEMLHRSGLEPTPSVGSTSKGDNVGARDRSGISSLAFQSLPWSHQKVMLKLRRKIHAVMSEQILSSLLKVSPLTQASLEYVNMHLQRLDKRKVVRFTILLDFVDDLSSISTATSPESQTMLRKRQISRQNIQEDNKNIGETIVKTVAQNQHGISVFQTELQSGRYLPVNVPNNHSDAEMERRHASLFYLSPSDDSPLKKWTVLHLINSQNTSYPKMVVSIHEPHGDNSNSTIQQRKKEKEHIRAGILKTVHRVNQLILLNVLHERRSCPDQLFVTKTELSSLTPSASQLLSKDSRNETSAGQYACDLVYSTSLLLHDRIAPASVLSSIGTTALMSFKVDNRDNMFVYRDGEGKIHYFFLELNRRKKGSSVGSSLQTYKNTILLNVHGVDPPGVEITRDLCLMLENKLEMTTLSILSSLIARNSLFKLTSRDVDFLCTSQKRGRKQKQREKFGNNLSIDTEHTISNRKKHTDESVNRLPDRALIIELPDAIQDESTILELVQKSATSTMCPVRIADPAMIGATEGPSSLVLVYNWTKSISVRHGMRLRRTMRQMPSQFSIGSDAHAIGTGVAIVLLEVKCKHSHSSNKDEDERPSTWPNVVWNGDSLSYELIGADAIQNGHHHYEISDMSVKSPLLSVRLWAAGRINIDTLAEQCAYHVSQAVHLYAMKSFYFNQKLNCHCNPSIMLSQKTLSTFEKSWLGPLNRIVDSAVSINCLNVFRAHSSQNLPSWALYKATEALSVALKIFMDSEQLHSRDGQEPVLLVNYSEGNATPGEERKDDDEVRVFSFFKHAKPSLQTIDAVNSFFAGGQENGGKEKSPGQSSQHANLKSEKRVTPTLDSKSEEEIRLEWLRSEQEKPANIVLQGTPNFVLIGGINHSEIGEEDEAGLNHEGSLSISNHIILNLNAKSISVRTHGVAREKVIKYLKVVEEIVSWVKYREQVLQQVLHQKMGLFCHSQTTFNVSCEMTIIGGESLAHRRNRGTNLNQQVLGSSTFEKNSLEGDKQRSTFGLIFKGAAQDVTVSDYGNRVSGPLAFAGRAFQDNASRKVHLGEASLRSGKDIGSLRSSSRNTTDTSLLSGNGGTFVQHLNIDNISAFVHSSLPKRDNQNSISLGPISYASSHNRLASVGRHSSNTSTKMSNAKVTKTTESLDASFSNLLQDVHSMYTQGSYRAPFFRMKILRRQKDLQGFLDPVSRHGQHFQKLTACRQSEDTKSRSLREFIDLFATSQGKLSGRVADRSKHKNLHETQDTYLGGTKAAKPGIKDDLVSLQDREGNNIRSSYISTSTRNIDLPRGAISARNRDKKVKDNHMTLSIFNSSMRTARTLFSFRAPLFFHRTQKQRRACAASLSFYIRSLVNESPDLNFALNIQNAAGLLLIGINICERIVLIKVLCQDTNFHKVSTCQKVDSPDLFQHGAVLGLDVLLLATPQSEVLDSCLSERFGRDISRLMSKIRLAAFAISETATRAYEALGSESGQRRVDLSHNSFGDLDELYALRSAFFPTSSVPRSVSLSGLQTHGIAYKQLPMDVTNLTKAGLSHGVNITLPALLKYVARPDRAKVYGCTGRFSNPAGQNPELSEETMCYIVFSPVAGTRAAAAISSDEGKDSLEIYFVYDVRLTFQNRRRYTGSESRKSKTDGSALRQGTHGQLQIINKLWQATRRWLQKKLSLAAAHLLRDSLWYLARTKGLAHDQLSHLTRRVICNNIEDVDPNLTQLFSLQYFREGNVNEIRSSLFSHIGSFYDSQDYSDRHMVALNSLNLHTSEESPSVQYQCGGEILLIARPDQALEIKFLGGQPHVTLWRRIVGSSIGEIELSMISGLVLQVTMWLHSRLFIDM